MARPRKLNPTVIAAIEQATKLGATREIAAKYACVSIRTLYNWLASARSGSGTALEVQLLQAVERAEGSAAVHWLAMIEKAMPKDWRAAAHKLEKRYPETFGKNGTFSRREREALASGDAANLSDDDLDKHLREALAA